MVNKSQNIGKLKDNKITYIAIAQVIAALLVVFVHSIPDGMKIPNLINNLNVVIDKIPLPVFMIVSGFLLIHSNSIEKYGYIKMIKRKAIRLLIPYFIISISLLLPKIVMSNYVVSSATFDIEYIVNSFLYPRQGISSNLWFIPTLMGLIIISPILYYGIKKENKFYQVIILVIAFCMMFLPSITGILALNDIKNYIFWYYIGMLATIYSKIVDYFITARFTIIYMLLGFIIIIFAPETHVFTALYSLLMSLAVLSISKWIAARFPQSCRYTLQGKTYTIYLLSFPFQTIINIICSIIGVSVMPTMMLMFVTGLAVPIIIIEIAKLIEKNLKTEIISVIIGM